MQTANGNLLSVSCDDKDLMITRCAIVYCWLLLVSFVFVAFYFVNLRRYVFRPPPPHLFFYIFLTFFWFKNIIHCIIFHFCRIIRKVVQNFLLLVIAMQQNFERLHWLHYHRHHSNITLFFSYLRKVEQKTKIIATRKKGERIKCSDGTWIHCSWCCC